MVLHSTMRLHGVALNYEQGQLYLFYQNWLKMGNMNEEPGSFTARNVRTAVSVCDRFVPILHFKHRSWSPECNPVGAHLKRSDSSWPCRYVRGCPSWRVWPHCSITHIISDCHMPRINQIKPVATLT
jgi:hypothetical protein